MNKIQKEKITLKKKDDRLFYNRSKLFNSNENIMELNCL